MASNAGSPGGLSVLNGNGDGTFQRGVFYPAGIEGEFVAVGDFNNDHKLDLVNADFVDDVLVTLLNTGTVTFSPTTPITFPANLLGTTTAPLSATLTNNGKSSLTISSVKSSGPPFKVQTTCKGSIAPGASCKITAIFTARVEGVTTGTVSVQDSASLEAASGGDDRNGQRGQAYARVAYIRIAKSRHEKRAADGSAH